MRLLNILKEYKIKENIDMLIHLSLLLQAELRFLIHLIVSDPVFLWIVEPNMVLSFHVIYNYN